MKPAKPLLPVLGAMALLAASGTAQAIIPVTDVGAILQLISQLQVLEEQVETARHQLEQAQSEFQSMTGGRGMDRLLAETTRDYLPATWNDIQSAAAGGQFATPVSAAVANNAVLSDQQLAALAPDARQRIETDRRSAALLQILSQQSLAVISSRFASLQSLIDAIGSATDQKAILDLQARIAAEQSMQQNDQTKLQLVRQAAEADDAANRQRAREQALAGHGQFASRFRPVP